MANFINIYSSITAYNADETKEYPNVSYLETEDMVKWQATDPKIVAKYNVTDTSNPTKILSGTSNITAMIVDGVQQPNVTTGFTFSTTGEHTVKYKINSSWNGRTAFASCSGLTTITIPDSVTSIGENAFKYCSGLTTITIPDSVTSIGGSAFQICSSLTSVTIPDSVTSIGGSAFEDCYSLTSVTIPDSVTSIGGNAFSQCTGLTNVTIGSGVTSIGDSTFQGCKGLASIIISDNVTSIGIQAFNNCTSLTTVTIGSGITNINSSFNSCRALRNVTVKAITPPSGNPFPNSGNNFTIYVPADSVNAYKTAWSSYASRIQAIQ